MLDLDSLLRPVSEDAPAGADLEYDAEFLALEELARGKPERQVGESTISAEPPEWREVQPAAIALFGRTKDLRVAVALTRAVTNLQGMPGLVAGLSLIDELVRRYWDGLYPPLDVEDNNDPTMRMNALAAIADDTALLRDLRMTVLATGSMGRVLVRDAEIALEVMTAPADVENVYTIAQVEGMIQTAMQESGAPLENLPGQALEVAKRLSDYLAEVAGFQSVDLAPLVNRLKPVAAMVARIIESLQPTESAAGEGAAGGAAGALNLQGEIQNRDQAMRLLEKVCTYLERAEPSNPAPLLIRRAQRLLSMNFMDIMRDLAPESISTIETISGANRNEDQ